MKVLYFLLGAAAGSVAGVLLTRKHYAQIAEAEIEEMRWHYLENSEKDTVIVASTAKNPPKPDLMSYYNNKSEAEQSEDEHDDINKACYISEVREEIERSKAENAEKEVNYDDSEEILEEMEEQEAQIGSVEEFENAFDTEPYAISSDEFVDFGRNDKVTVTYFAGDHTLMNEDEEVIDLEVIGGNMFLDDFDDDDTLYIRNNGRGIDYEVIRSESSYADAIQEAWRDEE